MKLIIFIPLFIFLFSCTKDENGISADPTEIKTCGVLHDERDGQSYKTVIIGDKCWMAENLNVGIMIDGSFDQTDNDTIEKYCYDNKAENCDIYGGLYQWDELMNYNSNESAQGICPEGWYVPSDADWKNLEIALGMTPSEADIENSWRGHGVGTALKDGGKSGFNVLYAGQRTSSGNFIQFDGTSSIFAYFYTSTLSDNEHFVWRRCFRLGHSGVGRFNTFSRNSAFSVRCVTDI